MDKKRIKAIREALAGLNPASDEDWTEDGLPVIIAVATLLGDNKLTRQEITEAAPGFSRSHPSFEARGATDEPKAEAPVTPAPLPAEPENLEAAIKEKRESIYKMRAEREALNKALGEAERELDRLTLKLERQTPKQSQSEAIKAVVAAEQGARSAAGPSAIDTALSVRRPVVRPSVPMVEAGV